HEARGRRLPNSKPMYARLTRGAARKTTAGGFTMSDVSKAPTRRAVLGAGAALAAVPFAGPAFAQGARAPTKVLDFHTHADVAKAEQEGELVFYCHENEAGTAAIMEGFGKDFPKVKPEEAPKTWKDLLDPRWRNAMSCKIPSSGIQFVQWYMFRKIYWPDYWREFAKQRPRAFDSRVQLFDRLAKGDDKVTAIGE